MVFAVVLVVVYAAQTKFSLTALRGAMKVPASVNLTANIQKSDFSAYARFHTQILLRVNDRFGDCRDFIIIVSDICSIVNLP